MVIYKLPVCLYTCAQRVVLAYLNGILPGRIVEWNGRYITKPTRSNDVAKDVCHVVWARGDTPSPHSFPGTLRTLPRATTVARGRFNRDLLYALPCWDIMMSPGQVSLRIKPS